MITLMEWTWFENKFVLQYATLIHQTPGQVNVALTPRRGRKRTKKRGRGAGGRAQEIEWGGWKLMDDIDLILTGVYRSQGKATKAYGTPWVDGRFSTPLCLSKPFTSSRSWCGSMTVRQEWRHAPRTNWPRLTSNLFFPRKSSEIGGLIFPP